MVYCSRQRLKPQRSSARDDSVSLIKYGARLAPSLAALMLMAASGTTSALEFSDIAQEGQLRFLATHPDPGSYRYESRVRITRESFESGIVNLSTCHRQLDPIRKIVIAFNPKRLQELAILSAEGMGGLEIKGHLIEMTEVRRGASICIELQSRALDRIDQNTYRLQAGPLMRRYLDGYLPMQATLRFEWPADLATLLETQPPPQPGVRLAQAPSAAELDLTFAGRLSANIDLRLK